METNRTIFESHGYLYKGAAETLEIQISQSIDEIPSELFSIAMMLKNQMSMPMDFSTAFEAAKLITESFRVSHK